MTLDIRLSVMIPNSSSSSCDDERRYCVHENHSRSSYNSDSLALSIFIFEVCGVDEIRWTLREVFDRNCDRARLFALFKFISFFRSLFLPFFNEHFVGGRIGCIVVPL